MFVFYGEATRMIDNTISSQSPMKSEAEVVAYLRSRPTDAKTLGYPQMISLDKTEDRALIMNFYLALKGEHELNELQRIDVAFGSANDFINRRENTIYRQEKFETFEISENMIIACTGQICLSDLISKLVEKYGAQIPENEQANIKSEIQKIKADPIAYYISKYDQQSFDRLQTVIVPLLIDAYNKYLKAIMNDFTGKTPIDATRLGFMSVITRIQSEKSEEESRTHRDEAVAIGKKAKKNEESIDSASNGNYSAG